MSPDKGWSPCPVLLASFLGRSWAENEEWLNIFNSPSLRVWAGDWWGKWVPHREFKLCNSRLEMMGKAAGLSQRHSVPFAEFSGRSDFCPLSTIAPLSFIKINWIGAPGRWREHRLSCPRLSQSLQRHNAVLKKIFPKACWCLPLG